MYFDSFQLVMYHLHYFSILFSCLLWCVEVKPLEISDIVKTVILDVVDIVTANADFIWNHYSFSVQVESPRAFIFLWHLWKAPAFMRYRYPIKYCGCIMYISRVAVEIICAAVKLVDVCHNWWSTSLWVSWEIMQYLLYLWNKCWSCWRLVCNYLARVFWHCTVQASLAKC